MRGIERTIKGAWAGLSLSLRVREASASRDDLEAEAYLAKIQLLEEKKETHSREESVPRLQVRKGLGVREKRKEGHDVRVE